jgi:hypothetical protein
MAHPAEFLFGFGNVTAASSRMFQGEFNAHTSSSHAVIG